MHSDLIRTAASAHHELGRNSQEGLRPTQSCGIRVIWVSSIVLNKGALVILHRLIGA